MTTFTPVEGTKPGTSLRFSRGYVVGGATHAVAGEVATSGQTVTTVCGRTIVARTVYQTEAWARIRETWQRIGKTHVTGTCGRCATKAV